VGGGVGAPLPPPPPPPPGHRPDFFAQFD
jgi:hypothetical protein